MENFGPYRYLGTMVRTAATTPVSSSTEFIYLLFLVLDATL